MTRFSHGHPLKRVLCSCLLSGVILFHPRAYAQSEDEIPNNELRIFSSERGFRLNATHKVMPEYPEEALKAGAQGVVVLSLYHDSAGNASKIKVAESPHPALTCAAITAVKQWKWRLFRSEDIDRPILGKLTFKFVIEDGVGRVADPPDGGGFSSLKEAQPLRRRAVWPDPGFHCPAQD